MNESPTAAKADPKAKPEPSTAKGIFVLSIAGFCIFGMCAFGWHMGVALADLTLRVCG